MRSIPTLATITVCLLAIAGCYGASVDTGRHPSNKVIKKPFAACWIYGLVPPSTVETAAQCPSGVARVETRLSFVNQLVGFLTLGIYTPMEIVVTCAEESKSTGSLTPDRSGIVLPKSVSPREIRRAFAMAADQAVESGCAVLVEIGQ